MLDQIGAWVLERALPHLPADGALRGAIARGAYHHRAAWPYAATNTAPGHAAIYTGAPPAQTGIFANRVWDPERRMIVSIVDDGKSSIFGHPGVFASPSVLHADTVGDALRRASPTSRVVALSMKERSAVLPGGHTPDFVAWYDERAKGFTTSTHYTAALPDLIAAWQAKNPVSARFHTWEPLDRALLARAAGRDDQPGEGDWHGLGTTFPHALASAIEPHVAIQATPESTELLFDFARVVVDQHALGRDDATDLLALSVSATDWVGHVFGPDSWEALDTLIRADRALARFLRDIDDRGPVALLVTADHGAPPLPEKSREAGHDADRYYAETFVPAVERAIDDALGQGDWVDAFYPPYLYLSSAARRPERRDRAIAAAIAVLEKTPGIHAALDVKAAPAWNNDPDPVRRSVALSVNEATRGDLFLVPKPHSIVDEQTPKGAGTSHGSPWPYDTEVPVIFAGPGVTHLETNEPLSALRTASTIAALLGIEPPTRAPREPLPGVKPAR